MNTYNPESVKLQVSNKLVGGFIESDFLKASPRLIRVALNPFSESIPPLITTFNKGVPTYVKLESGLFNKDGVRLSYLDIEGDFRVNDYYTEYNVQNVPQVVFLLTRKL